VLLGLAPSKIIGIGLNYQDTVAEMGFEPPTAPYLFSKFPSSVIGSGDEIVFDPDVTTSVDWEGELAVVIGRRARRVSTADALDAVRGYTVANDISARELQLADGQWVRGKSLDTFCPLGPALVPCAAIGNPQELRIRTWVNDELVQDGSTADMVFPVAELVAYCSSFFTLEPDDVILTGTPAGCGGFRRPPRFLRDGDQVDVAIDGIGVLRNRVREHRHACI
jgi:2-keto-4-pentenoate hydratase/2-oxohepta-3-ene-1,7-dioic acid hydratase in catechol pathway